MPKLTDTMNALTGRRRSLAIGLLVLVVVVASAVAGTLAANRAAAVATSLAVLIVAVPGLIALKVSFERSQVERDHDRQLRVLDRGVTALQVDATAHVAGIETTRRSVDDLGQRTDQLIAELNEHLSRMHAELNTYGDELSARIDQNTSSLDRRLSELVQTAEETKHRASTVGDLYEDQAKHLADHAQRLALLDEKARVNAWHVGVERRVRVARDAERRSTGLFPTRVLLQMTLTRSGSTQLFDMLRCHPEVFMEPSNLAWKALGLSGRRYPIGLSDLPGATTPVVVLDDVGALIRGMRTDDIGDLDRPTGTVAVEKAHPLFYDFDDERFAEKVTRVEAEHGAVVDILYQVRSPLEVMWSMAEYKIREPGWHGSLEIEDIPPLVLRSLRSIEDLHRLRPGIVIDYSDVHSESRILKEVARSISPNDPPEAHAEWIEIAFARTARERLGATTVFVGERSQRTPIGPDSVWRHQRSIIDEANSVYEMILTHRDTGIDDSG